MPTKIKTFDLSLIIIPIIFIVLSVAVIFSLVTGTANEGLGLKQGIAALIGIGLLFTSTFVDYRIFRGTAWIFYLFSLILLVVVLFFGKTVNGATNWLNLGFFQLQPSELAKVSLILSIASFFADKVGKIRFRDILVSLLFLIPPIVLILMEPDLGTAMVIISIYLFMLIFARPTRTHLLIIGATALVIISVTTLAYLNVFPFKGILHDYQRDRIAVFLDPTRDPIEKGYNVHQAQITIGSGGIIGKGLGKGSQSQLQFLPEPHTDFIIAGIGESFGFLGIFVLLALYCFLIVRMLDIAVLSRDNFGMLVTFGVVLMFLVQIFINIGMNIGLVPVAGITLPLLSYGGTSLVVSLFSIGLVESIFIRHRKISF